jgi:hypothetical protein
VEVEVLLNLNQIAAGSLDWYLKSRQTVDFVSQSAHLGNELFENFASNFVQLVGIVGQIVQLVVNPEVAVVEEEVIELEQH